MQGPIYVNLVKKFKKYILKSGLDDGKPHTLLDRHPSHVAIDVLKYARGNNIHLFQLQEPVYPGPHVDE